MAAIHEEARPERLSVDHSVVDGVRVVTLRGEIDHSVRDTLHEALLPPEDVLPPRTVADLSGVRFMDSSGINVLIAAHGAAQHARGWLRLAAPQEAVMRIIEIVGIDAVIPCYPALGEALSA